MPTAGRLTRDVRLSNQAMKLVPCRNPQCLGEHSQNAHTCPKCGSTTSLGDQAAKTYPCRVCKSPLIVRRHVKKQTRSYVSDGSTKWSVSYHYRYPCPNCGEPEPLKNFRFAYSQWLAGVCLLVAPLWLVPAYELASALEHPDRNLFFGFHLPSILGGIPRFFKSAISYGPSVILMFAYFYFSSLADDSGVED